jgi:branched-chain amino acid transport system substrate-binding protein
MRLRIALIAPALALAATPGLAQEKEIRIGFINTFSGGAAVYGKHQKDGLELALDHLGRKMSGLDVKMIYGDDQRKPDVGRQQADKMLKKDKVHVVAGITWSNVLAAVQKRVVRAKKILISTNAGWSAMAGKNCSPYFFTTSWNNDQTPEAMGELMNQEKLDNVFLISANYQAGKDMLTGFERTYKGKVAKRILYRLGQRDYQAEISQIRAAKPAALFGFVPGPMGIAFVKQYRAAGLHKTIPFYSVFTVDYLTLGGHGKAAIGTYHTSYWNNNSDDPVNKRFIADFKKKYGYHPSMFSAQAYDMPMLVDSGVKGAKGNPNDVKAMIAEMEKADFPSTRGKFAYNTNHIPIQNFYRREVRADADGNPVIVTTGVVKENHKDSYYKECKFKW